MTAVRLHPNSAQQISAFIDAVEAFARELPDTIVRRFERKGADFDLRIEAPTPDHRQIILSGNPIEFEYSLGKVWTEGLDPAEIDLEQILAMLDSVRDGKVREARDRRTGVIYHVYRLNTRGLRTWLKDGQYSMWHWLRLKIRQVDVHTLPPLVTGKA